MRLRVHSESGEPKRARLRCSAWLKGALCAPLLWSATGLAAPAELEGLEAQVEAEELESVLSSMGSLAAMANSDPSWERPWADPLSLQASVISAARRESARRAERLPEGWADEERWRAWQSLESEVKRAWEIGARGEPDLRWREEMGMGGPKPLSHTWRGGSDGFLLNAPRLKDGPLWDTRRYKNYATPEAITAIKAGVYALHLSAPDAPTTIIGDLSKRYGGHFPPHLSHQSGRDADIGYFVRGPLGRRLKGLMKTSYRQLDAEKTWAFLEGMLKTGLVEQIYMDYKLQKKVYRHARRSGVAPALLKRWLSFPFTRGGVIRHLKGHDDHIHVRFKAPSSEASGAALVKAEGARSLRPRPRYARVRRGDSLARLAKRHRVPLSSLRKWNRLSSHPSAQIKRKSVIVGFHTPWHLAQR